MTKCKHPENKAQRLKYKKIKLSEKVKAEERPGRVRRKLSIERVKEQETKDEVLGAYNHDVDVHG